VLDGWNLLRQNTKQVFLIGLSMGGALALYHGSFLPAAGVVSMSTPYQIQPSLRLKLLPFLTYFLPYASKGKPDWQDQDAKEEHFSYDQYPTRAIQQLNDLLGSMRRSLPEVTIPALLMHSKKDQGVIPANMEWISRDIGTPKSSLNKIWLENSGHVVTRDLDKDLVFNSINNFIRHVLANSE
jgi:carboxylesterase